jgi:hypothetical protein
MIREKARSNFGLTVSYNASYPESPATDNTRSLTWTGSKHGVARHPSDSEVGVAGHRSVGEVGGMSVASGTLYHQDTAGSCRSKNGCAQRGCMSLWSVGVWNSVAPECGCLELPNLETAAEWLRDDPEFIASLNRAKSFRRERLRADVRSLASAAMATLRELVRPDVAASIRLRASLAILQAADALNIEAIGPTPAEGVEAKLEDERFIESLSG